MEFSTQFNVINHSTPEINSGEVMVETAGYIDSQTKIENMIFAGQRLEMSRSEDFDYNDDNVFDDENNDMDIDPTRYKGLDMAEASEIDRSMYQKFIDWKKSKMSQKNAKEELLDDAEATERALDASEKIAGIMTAK